MDPMLLLRTFGFLVLVLFSMLASAADQNKIDSLKAKIEADIADTTRFRLLFDLAEELGTSDTVLALSSLEEGREIADRLDNVRGLGRYNKVLGKIEAAARTQAMKLSLYNSQLAELPPEIGNLANLTKLYIHENRLTKLPPEIGQLTKLTRLLLNGNQLGPVRPYGEMQFVQAVARVCRNLQVQ